MTIGEHSIGDAATMRPGGGALGRIDQYELVRELGGGGFGTVYLARDTVAGIEVAVKGLPPIIRNNVEELERIRANFALVSRLHHPYIAAALVLHPAKEVVYCDSSVRQKLRVDPGDTLMVMEYAPGVTLSKWRKQFPGGKVPLEPALQLVWQIAQALDYAHEQHIIHRDIKPSNIIVETKPDGEVTARLLDFGLAAEVRSSMGRVSREIHDTSGTRPYMAPEQWSGRKQGPATDQYALAVLLCELLTGEVPFASVFETGDPVVMMTAVTTRAPEIPVDDLPKPVRRTLVRALAKKPEERFASCCVFVDALEGMGVEDFGHKGHKKGGAWKMFAVFAFLATLVGGGTWFYSQYQEQARVATKRQKEDARKAVEAAECQANAKAEAERKADEERARLTVEAAARAAATEIRIEAMVQNKKVEPISDEDGFKAYKDKLSDDFARAEACFDEKTKQWSEAAARFTNYVSQCKALVELHGEWQRAVASRTKAEAEKSRAAKAEAEKYASTNWNKAVGLWQKANARFKEMKFAESGNVFVSAARQFMQCADDAAAEQNRQKEEVEAKARKVAAERERRKSEEVEGTKIKKVTVGDTFQIVFACKDNGMWVTKDPISWKEYIAVVGEAPADFLDVNLPATNVSWEDCKVFADRFPMRVRLPNSDELREQVVTSSVRREWCSDDNNPSVAFAYDFSLARKYSFCKNSRNVDLGFRIVLND